MKIGILTFHSQLNYGGVLQAFALQEALCGLGHEAVVIDRWLEPDNRSLELGYDRLSEMGWAKAAARSLLGGWELRKYRRVRATRRFLRDYLHLTPYHFVDWEDAPRDLGLDLIVVGSDQVWHVGDYSDPRAYLLEDAPSIRAVAYAASFGMTAIPASHEAQYRAGLSRFARISCRESEGVSLCRSLGFEATHVVDPTLLLDSAVWHRLVKTSPHGPKRKLVCYLMDGDVPAHMRELEAFARQNDLDVEVFLDGRFFVPLPKTLGQLWSRYRPSRINCRIEAGPMEFVQAIADADFVLTDSFHALMFSAIFDKNIRFVRPGNAVRLKMFARITEFAEKCVGESILVDDVMQALVSFVCGEKITYDIEKISAMQAESLEWVKEAIEG